MRKRKRRPTEFGRKRYKTPIRPAIVDLRTDRMTVPTPSGKQFPVLMGAGATGALMYVAAAPGCRIADVREGLEITRAAFQSRFDRLRAMGLVIGDWRYQINTGLDCRVQFVRFLRGLAAAYGMTPEGNSRVLRSDLRRNVPFVCPMPEDLFGTPNRTRILLLIAALGETYVRELHDVTGIDLCAAGLRLHEFVNEGVLRLRVVKRVKLYGLSPDYRAAAHLEVLLRCMAASDERIGAAANQAHVRRYAVAKAGNARERAIFDDISNRAIERKRMSTRGVRREFGKRAWRFANGLSDYAAWRRKGEIRKPVLRSENDARPSFDGYSAISVDFGSPSR